MLGFTYLMLNIEQGGYIYAFYRNVYLSSQAAESRGI